MFLTRILHTLTKEVPRGIRSKRRPSRRNSLIGGAGRGYSRALAVEPLEDRSLLTAFLVNTPVDNPLADVADTDGLVSLREAITAANTNAAFGDAAAGGVGDSIMFDLGSGPHTITLGGTQLPIADDLSLTGPGGANLTISGNNTSRVFNIIFGADVEISDVTIAGGNDGGDYTSPGGGVANHGNLTMTNTTISNNVSSGLGGGGIYNAGTMIIDNSLITLNRAIGGGGVCNIGSLTMTESTVSGNSATSHGGGIANIGGRLSITDSTLSANSALTGGGIYNTSTKWFLERNR
jgi:hypothetical protein